ncbi:MAG: response regulator [Chitinispirillaceae bacterium]|nr:response regulator [Chitinispirillaceae bacterium]
MSPLALYLLFFSLIITAIGFYTYFTNQKSELNGVFFALALFWAYWHFIEFGLHTSESVDMVVAWYVLGALRVGVVPLMLHFMLLYTGRINGKKQLPLHLALYLPVVIITAIEVVGILTWYEPLTYTGGWIIERKSVVITGLFMGWILTLCALILLTAITFDRSGEKKIRFFTGLMILLAVIGTATWILDPLTLRLPGLFTMNGITVMTAFTFLIYRRNFFTISPMTAAEDILAAIPDALLITTIDGDVQRINAKAEVLTGYERADVARLHIDHLFAAGFARNIYTKAVSSERNTLTQESMLRTKPGNEIPVVVNVALILKTKKNIPVAMVISCHDSSFEKMALDEFRKTEQLEALGFLAGGIAHDFNNLLTSIVAYLSLARSTEEISDSMREKLDKVDSAAHMVINLNRQLAAISKGSKPNKERCSLKEIIDSAIQLALSGSSIECHRVIPDDLHSIDADATQFNQVFLNLLVNARQAMDHGGIVGIICRNISIDDAPGIEVAISDQGSGVQSANIDDIFKPFYTTKEQGTGLGLSVVKSVVEKHGGTISVSTRRSVGTTFMIRLPAQDTRTTDPQAPEPADDMQPPKTGKILVMDDEEGVKRAITMMLTERGHTVVGVDHGAAAISVYLKHRSEGTPFDLLILDVTIRNGYGAQEVIRRVRQIDPGALAIVMSGYRENILMKEYQSYGFIDVIPKPFDSHHIYHIVNKALLRRQEQVV